MSKSETTLCVASTSGTEYEHLSKSEIRKRLQQGAMRLSQFIWHPNDQSWKQARAFPDLADSPDSCVTIAAPAPISEDPTLCVALPSGSEYEHLPKSEIRKRLQQGAMRLSQFIWHPDDQSWKQARAFPGLNHSPTPQPAVTATTAPAVKVVVAATPKVAVAVATPKAVAAVAAAVPQLKGSIVATSSSPASSPTVPKDKTAMKISAVVRPLPSSAPQPGVKVSASIPKPMPAAHVQPGAHVAAAVARPAAATPDGVVAPQPAAKANFADEMVRKQRQAQKLYAWLSAGTVLVVLFLNWFCAHHALASAVSHSEFKGKVGVVGHYGFFASPFVLIVHLGDMPSDMTPEKFVDLLTLLAVNTQKQPITGFNYHTIKLKKGLSTQFALRGAAWKVLAEMKNSSPAERGMLLTDNLYLPNGKQALSSESDNLIEIAQEKKKLFSEFYNTFAGKKSAGTTTTAPTSSSTATQPVRGKNK